MSENNFLMGFSVGEKDYRAQTIFKDDETFDRQIEHIKQFFEASLRSYCHRAFSKNVDGKPVKRMIENGREYWDLVE